MADLVEEGCTHVVLEVSSQAMITNRVDDVKFDIAGFTNFSEDHISKYEHHSLDEYFRAKISLLEKSPKVVINWDDEKVRECYSILNGKEIHDTGIIKESENINETHLPYVYVREEEIILTEKRLGKGPSKNHFQRAFYLSIQSVFHRLNRSRDSAASVNKHFA